MKAAMARPQPAFDGKAAGDVGHEHASDPRARAREKTVFRRMPTMSPGRAGVVIGQG